MHCSPPTSGPSAEAAAEGAFSSMRMAAASRLRVYVTTTIIPCDPPAPIKYVAVNGSTVTDLPECPTRGHRFRKWVQLPTPK